MKKAKTREMNTKKKAELAAGRAAIKRLPKKQQAAARKKLTAAVKAKYDKIKKMLPPAGKKTAAELTGMLKARLPSAAYSDLSSEECISELREAAEKFHRPISCAKIDSGAIGDIIFHIWSLQLLEICL